MTPECQRRGCIVFDEGELQPAGWWLIGDKLFCSTHHPEVQALLQARGFVLVHAPEGQSLRRIRVTGHGDLEAFFAEFCK